jgi:hypothetical protein
VRSRGWRRRELIVALMATLVAACSSQTIPNPSPTGASQVERPTTSASSAVTLATNPVASAAATLAPSPTPAASPSGSPAPTYSPSPATAWTQVALPVNQNGPAAVADIVATASGFVAVGSAGDQAVAWVSGDGISWQEAAIGQGRAFAAALLPGRVAALGQTLRQGVAAWSSSDGLLWSPGPTFDRVPQTLEQLGPDGLARAPAGYVAFGSGTTETTRSRTVWLWTSTDGRRFTHVPPSSLPRTLDQANIVGSPGGFLTYGSGVPSWRSPDGQHWQVIRGAPVLDAVAYVQGRFLGIAGSRVWTSRTGRNWRRVGTIHIDRNCGVVELAWTGVGYAAVVYCHPSIQTSATRVTVMLIRSDDGSAWSSETVVSAVGFFGAGPASCCAGGASPRVLAVHDGVAVLVGGVAGGGPMAWARTLTSP